MSHLHSLFSPFVCNAIAAFQTALDEMGREVLAARAILGHKIRAALVERGEAVVRVGDHLAVEVEAKRVAPADHRIGPNPKRLEDAMGEATAVARITRAEAKRFLVSREAKMGLRAMVNALFGCEGFDPAVGRRLFDRADAWSTLAADRPYEEVRQEYLAIFSVAKEAALQAANARIARTLSPLVPKRAPDRKAQKRLRDEGRRGEMKGVHVERPDSQGTSKKSRATRRRRDRVAA